MRAALHTSALAALMIACSAAAWAADTSPVADKEQLLSQPFRSDEGIAYTASDLRGVYEFRPTHDAAYTTLDTDGFVAWIKQNLSNRTLRDLEGAHGWLAEYTTADGRSFLWYPGNHEVVHGFWQVLKTEAHAQGKAFEVVQICFRYLNSYNPVTKQALGDWDCWPEAQTVAHIELQAPGGREFRDGDVFNLMSGKVPYVMDKTVRPAWPDEAQK